MSYFYYGWAPYVSVAERRLQAERKIAALKKRGRSIAPVKIEGRIIARSFWAKSWCANLERYSDFANRLPRGRSYVRNGSVVDLRIVRGEVAAMVAGSELYTVKIAIAPVVAKRWKAICRDCAGGIDSLVELLQGRLATSVMARVCREGDGLFPAPKEIKLSCSCPDWADMCKHVAATLYAVGARLDEKPQLLFTLRGVDESELLASTGDGLADVDAAPAAAKLLDEGEAIALFGLDPAGIDGDRPASAVTPKPERIKPSKADPGRATRTTPARASRVRPKPKLAHPVISKRPRTRRQPKPSA